jgi:hypothetical protein
MFKMVNKKLKGANMDIDLIPNENVGWQQDKCPWSEEDGQEHKCAVKSKSLCDYFQGIVDNDVVLCSYPDKGESN